MNYFSTFSIQHLHDDIFTIIGVEITMLPPSLRCLFALAFFTRFLKSDDVFHVQR